MAFCINCGKPIVDGSKFCPNCGVSQSMAANNTQRKFEWAGTIVKCPSCGEDIPSFTAICPVCGHEFNLAKVSSVLKEFIDNINECDRLIATDSNSSKTGWVSWGKSKRIWWVILNIYLRCIPLIVYLIAPLIKCNSTPRLTPEEKKKSSLIENFPFPNEREALLEALLFVKSKISYLASEKVDRKNAYWTRLWSAKGEQLYQRAELLFEGDEIANNAYEEIIAQKRRVSKAVKLRIGSGILIILTIIFLVIFSILIEAGVFVSTSSADETSDTEGIYTYEVRNYIGKNVASIGKEYEGYQIDEYGSGKLKLIFLAENGVIISPDDENLKKQYAVVEQSIKAGSTLAITHLKDSKGKPYSNLIDYQSYDEIVLFVAPIGNTSYEPSYISLLPTLDKHIYHIRDYVGRNAASFGKYYSNEYIDEYGSGKLRISFNSEDGSYIDSSDKNILKCYVVTGQDIDANTELKFEYETDSRGKEFDTLIQNQNYEEINLTIKKLDNSLIVNMPELQDDNKSSGKELTLEYEVLDNGKAKITGFSGNGNHATINKKIDGHKVICIGKDAFKNCDTLEAVSFLADVETIEEYAFYECTSLKEISLPNKTKNIEAHAFEGCTSLTDVFLWGDPDIGEYAFAGCTDLQSIDIGNDTKNVGAHAFDGCLSLSEVYIWNDDTIVGKDAFANCPKLEDRPVQK